MLVDGTEARLKRLEESEEACDLELDGLSGEFCNQEISVVVDWPCVLVEISVMVVNAALGQDARSRARSRPRSGVSTARPPT